MFVKRDGAGGGDDGGGGGGGAGGGDGDLQATIGSDLRAGNRNRGLAARASHTPRVLPKPSPSCEPTDAYTWDSWQAGDKRARGSSTRTSFFSSGNRRNRRHRARYRRDTRVARYEGSRNRRSDISPFQFLFFFFRHFRFFFLLHLYNKSRRHLLAIRALEGF